MFLSNTCLGTSKLEEPISVTFAQGLVVRGVTYRVSGPGFNPCSILIFLPFLGLKLVGNNCESPNLKLFDAISAKLSSDRSMNQSVMPWFK